MTIAKITTFLMENTFSGRFCNTSLYSFPILNLFLRVMEETTNQQATQKYLGINVESQSFWRDSVMPYQKDYLLGMAIQAIVTANLGRHLFSSQAPHSWMKWGCFGLLSLNLAISIPWHYVQEGGGVLFTPENSQNYDRLRGV